ncbi:MAG: ATP-grasp domain-containing protein, partial [Pseudomonadota bacterium]
AFAEALGGPMVVKPPAGAGGKGTWRLDNEGHLAALLNRYPPSDAQPCLLEEFMAGQEHSFDSVVIDGKLVWHSISRYSPSPLQVMENAWIQWCVMLPRDIDGPQYDAIRSVAAQGLTALGLDNGLTHMEWFQRDDGSVAISEVGARPPGAQITTLLSYAHDRDFYHAWPRLMAFEEFQPPARSYACGAAYFRGQGTGRIKGVHGIDEVRRRFGPIIVEMRLPAAGQSRSDSYEGDGYCIVRHPDTAVVDDALNSIIRLVHVDAH